MRLKKNLALAAVSLAAASFSSAAFAQKAGDVTIYVGGAYIMPSGSNVSGLSTDGPATNPYQASVLSQYNSQVSKVGASVDNSAAFIVSAFYMFTDHIGAELTLGAPVLMKVTTTDPAGSYTNAANARAAFPSLVAKWVFNDPGDAWRPYLGVGVNYTYFNDVTANLDYPNVRSLANAGAALSSSWNPVLNGGVIYNFNDNWSLNAGVSWVPLTSTATFSSNVPSFGPYPGGTYTTTGKLTINPFDVTLKIGYRF